MLRSDDKDDKRMIPGYTIHKINTPKDNFLVLLSKHKSLILMHMTNRNAVLIYRRVMFHDRVGRGIIMCFILHMKLYCDNLLMILLIP